jgi:ribosomal protein S18 acetylase RimI-like enzyme
MFTDAEVEFAIEKDVLAANFIEWLRPKLEDGTYAGWLAEEHGAVVAGAGLWEMDWPPHFLHGEPRRAYLLNFYVAPKARRHGLARKLLALAVGEAKARGIDVVTLHASKFGKPLYERSGFVTSNEMRLVSGDSGH